MSVRGRAFSLKIGGGRGGFFSNYQCRCSKKQSTVAINSPHNVKENWNFVFHSKNLLFCSYSRRNLTEKITLDFFFLIFFFTFVDHYLPTYIFGQPSKKYLITRKKKITPPLFWPKLLRVLPMLNVKFLISNDTGVEYVHLKGNNRSLVSTFPTEVETL